MKMKYDRSLIKQTPKKRTSELKNKQSFSSYLNHHSEEIKKHQLIKNALEGAYIMGRDLKSKISQQSRVLGSYKLIFHPDDGIAEHRGAEYQFKGKARAFLTFLHNSKNTPFSIDDIKTKCNPLIANERYHFKGDKDARDTASYIREMLKVNKGEFFPIGKRNNNWIWIEK